MKVPVIEGKCEVVLSKKRTKEFRINGNGRLNTASSAAQSSSSFNDNAPTGAQTSDNPRSRAKKATEGKTKRRAMGVIVTE